MRTKKYLTIQQFELPIEIEKERDVGFIAQCPTWSDCYAQGETLEQSFKRNILCCLFVN